MLQSTQSGIIAGVGLVVLLWSVLKLFGNIESSFNSIWKVKLQRTFTRKISDYFAMMLLCPILFAVSSSLSVFIFTHLTTLSQSGGFFQKMSPLLVTGYHLFPFFLSWFIFSAIYYVMPNTHVPLKYACIAGIIAGTAYQIIQWTYIQFQLGLSSYGAIYGSFAALPLFLIWLNTSWLTTLAGAEIAYHAQQDSLSRGGGRGRKDFTLSDGRILTLLIMQESLSAFFSGNKAPDIETLSTHIGASADAIDSHVEMLLDKGLLVKVFVGDHSSIGYQPGKDPNLITVKAVCDAVDSARGEKYIVSESNIVHRYEEVLASLDAIIATTLVNQPLRSFFVDTKQKS
jgi:membrane protein